MHKLAFVYAAVTVLAVPWLLPAQENPGRDPLSPGDALKTIKTQPGFRVELVAAEPDVIDPVAMTFDEHGRLFVVEMRGYPNGGLGQGIPLLPGRIKCLEDRDGNGSFETVTTFTESLRFPTGIAVWRGGLLVGDAPELLYFRDTDGDGKADERSVLYTGFGTRNIQQLLNSLQFHHDHWFYGCNGSNESVIRCPQRPELPPVVLRGRHFRFQPDVPGSLQPASGGGQYGLTADVAGNWFTATNSQHLRHIVLPDHYLARNPHLRVSTTTADIPDGVDEHGPAAKVFRISPYEAWRVDRTARRAGSDDRLRFPLTELTPGGYMTSACSPLVYLGGAFSAEYEGSVFVCDPANNLIHRDVLVADGPTFQARRGEAKAEFLASTDNWFRPVFLCLGPDGAMYIADFYREIIETPLSLPEDIQRRYNLQSRERGRIWRIVHDKHPRRSAPKLSALSNRDLVEELKSPNAWRRLTAQRLLNERSPTKEVETIACLKRLVDDRSANNLATTRAHALCLLNIWGLDPATLRMALSDPSPLVRKEAVRLTETFLQSLAQMNGKWSNAEATEAAVVLQQSLLALVDDSSDMVRFQLALSLGGIPPSGEARRTLLTLAKKDGANPWHQTAILSSCLPYAPGMLDEFVAEGTSAPTFLIRLGEIAAASSEDFLPTLQKLLRHRPDENLWCALDGAARGLQGKGQSLVTLAVRVSAVHRDLDRAFRLAQKTAIDPRADIGERQSALHFLRHGPWRELASTVISLLAPQTPQEIQSAAVQCLASRREPEVAALLCNHWSSFSPSVRREAQEVVFARMERIQTLLHALEEKTIIPAQIDASRQMHLRQHPRADIRERAVKIFSAMPSDRRRVVQQHDKALHLAAESDRGREVFRKHCAACHRLEDHGHTVGPELRAALKTKTAQILLNDILDPNREVDSRYVNYLLENKRGLLVTGMLAEESASSVTLRRADGAQDTVLRAEIETLQTSGLSLMPEDFEKQLTQQELADVIAYLLSVGRGK